MAPVAVSEGEPALARPRDIACGERGAPAECGAALPAERFDPLLQGIARHLEASGADAYVFGGAVRDALLDLPGGDLDLWVGAPVRRVGRGIAGMLGGSYFDLDAGRGIGRVTAQGPRPVTIDITGGGPGADIASHLAASDFTIDAMAASVSALAAGRAPVIDPVGGLADLRAGTVRAVSPAALDDDPLRLLRGPRIAVALGMTLEPATALWIRDRADLLRGVSPERVRDELLRVLAAPWVTPALRSLDELGLLTAAIPELEEARGVVQPPEHHYDVLDHCIETPGALRRVLAGTGPAFGLVPRFEGMDEHFSAPFSDGADRATLLALTCLLHDVAKPATRTVEPGGRVRFLGHGERGAKVCRELMERLRFSRRSVRYVAGAVESHLRPGQAAAPGELPTPRAIYRYRRDLGDLAIDVLYLNMADYVAAKGPPMLRAGYDLSDWRRHCGGGVRPACRG